MLRAQAFGGAASHGRFAEREFRENHGERVQRAAFASGERGETRGIHAARQKQAQRNIRNQVAAHGGFEQRAQRLRRAGESYCGRLGSVRDGVGQAPVAFRRRFGWTRDVGHLQAIAGRQRKNIGDQRFRFGKRTKQEVRRERGR